MRWCDAFAPTPSVQPYNCPPRILSQSWGCMKQTQWSSNEEKRNPSSSRRFCCRGGGNRFHCQTTATRCMMGNRVSERQLKDPDHSPLSFLWCFMVFRSASSVPDVSCRLYISGPAVSVSLHLFLILDMQGAGHQSSGGF